MAKIKTVSNKKKEETDRRKEIRLLFENAEDPVFKKISANAKKQHRSPAAEILTFLEQKYK